MELRWKEGSGSEVRNSVLQEMSVIRPSYHAYDCKDYAKNLIAAPANWKTPTADHSPQKASAEPLDSSTLSKEADLTSRLHH